MKKILKKLNKKNILLYLLALLIPIFIGAIGFYACLKSTIISNNTILYGDLQVQYVSLFSYLQDVFKEGSSLGFLFVKGLGGNMVSTIAYYLISPINILVLFTSKTNIPFMLLIIILIKLGLAGLFMYKYLSYINKKHSHNYLIFSTCYALSAYAINYFFCIMWLDALYMLPLVCLGIHKIIDNKSSLLYIVTLFITIFTNYYMGYMICIFACIYFIYEIILQNKYKDKKKLIKYSLKFIVSSFLAGMLTMFLLIPMIYDLSTTARSIGSAMWSISKFNFDFDNLINRLLFASHTAIDVENLRTINIYFGTIMLPLIYFYFINKKIEKKEKIFSGFIIFLFLISYCYEFINCAWHGFAFPHGLNYRYSYIFIFYFLIMASKSFMNIKEIKKIHYFIFIAGFLIIFNIVNILNYHDIDYLSLYMSLGLLILYLLILYNLNNKKYNKKLRDELSIILIFFVCGELLFNIYLSLHSYFGVSSKQYKDYITIYGNIIDKYKPKQNEYYRIGETSNFTYNPGLLFNYPSMTNFLSTNNVDVLNFLAENGYFANNIAIIYHDNNNIISDSILGVKYLISEECGDYEEIDTFKYSGFGGFMYGMAENDFKVCYNKNAAPLGFMTNKDIENYGENIKSYSNLTISESLLNKMINSNDQYYYPYEFTDLGNNTYKVKLDDKEKFYITIFPTLVSELASIYINDKVILKTDEFPGNIYILDNQYKNQEIEIRIEFEDGGKIVETNAYANFYWSDKEKIFTALQKLKENPLEIEVFSDDYIKGKVMATKEKSTLFTTIPYDKGWTLYVDGKETKITKKFDAFIGVELEEGEHKIELKYSVPGLKIGIVVSAINLILTGLYLYFEKKSSKKVK